MKKRLLLFLAIFIIVLFEIVAAEPVEKGKKVFTMTLGKEGPKEFFFINPKDVNAPEPQIVTTVTFENPTTLTDGTFGSVAQIGIKYHVGEKYKLSLILASDLDHVVDDGYMLYNNNKKANKGYNFTVSVDSKYGDKFDQIPAVNADNFDKPLPLSSRTLLIKNTIANTDDVMDEFVINMKISDFNTGGFIKGQYIGYLILHLENKT